MSGIIRATHKFNQNYWNIYYDYIAENPIDDNANLVKSMLDTFPESEIPVGMDDSRMREFNDAVFYMQRQNELLFQGAGLYIKKKDAPLYGLALAAIIGAGIYLVRKPSKKSKKK